MPNDDAAQRLIDAILPKLTESLLPQLTEAVEKQIKGVLTKNDELIEKLGTEKTRVDDFAKLLERHEKQMAETKALTEPKKPADETGPVILARSDARDRQKYLAAVEEAKKRGTQVQITDNPTQPSGDTRTHVATATQMLVSRQAARDTAVYKRLRAQAEREHLEFAVVTELPDAES
jgi:hypothetical protein